MCVRVCKRERECVCVSVRERGRVYREDRRDDSDVWKVRSCFGVDGLKEKVGSAGRPRRDGGCPLLCGGSCHHWGKAPEKRS